MTVRLGAALLLQLAAAFLSSLFLFFLTLFFFPPLKTLILVSLPSFLWFCHLFLFPGSSVYFLLPLLSLVVAGFSRLLVVCWGCCTTFCPRMLLSVFWRREKPWVSGLSRAKHKPGMAPTCIYTRTVYNLQSWGAPSQQEEEIKSDGTAWWKAVLMLPPPSDVFKANTQWKCVRNTSSHKTGDTCHCLKG